VCLPQAKEHRTALFPTRDLDNRPAGRTAFVKHKPEYVLLPGNGNHECHRSYHGSQCSKYIYIACANTSHDSRPGKRRKLARGGLDDIFLVHHMATICILYAKPCGVCCDLIRAREASMISVHCPVLLCRVVGIHRVSLVLGNEQQGRTAGLIGVQVC
jgi:hypothetical protein